MGKKEFGLRHDWDSIESVALEIWPDSWPQLNPLEIHAIEEIIENKKTLNSEMYVLSGGFGCEFSVGLEHAYYLLSILWLIKELTGLTNDEIKSKLYAFASTCDKEIFEVFKEVIEPQLDRLINSLRKKNTDSKNTNTQKK